MRQNEAAHDHPEGGATDAGVRSKHQGRQSALALQEETRDILQNKLLLIIFYINSLWPNDGILRHQIESIFWHQIWIPREIPIQMNGNMTMIRSLLAVVASKASSSCVLSSWGLSC